MTTIGVGLADIRIAAREAGALHRQAHEAREVLRQLMMAAGHSGRYSLAQITAAAEQGVGEHEARQWLCGVAEPVRGGRVDAALEALAQARAILAEAAREAFPAQVLTPVEAIVDAAAPALAQVLDERAAGSERGLRARVVLAEAVVKHFTPGCGTGARDVVSALELEVAEALLRAQG